MPRGMHHADFPQASDDDYVERPPRRRAQWVALIAVFAVLLVGAYMLTVGSPHKARLSSSSTSSTLFGASVNSGTLSKEESQFGHMPVVRVYFPATPPSNAWTTSPAAESDADVVVSWKALPSGSVRRGRRVAQELLRQRPHQPDDLVVLLPRARGQHQGRPVHPGRLQGRLAAHRRHRRAGAQPEPQGDPHPDVLRPEPRLGP